MAKKLKNIQRSYIKRVQVDPLYNSLWYSKFQNKLMLSGKKYLMEKSFAQIFIRVKKQYRQSPVRILFKILIDSRPLMGLIRKRVRTKFLDVPCPLEPRRQIILALKWLIGYVKTYSEPTLTNRLWGVLTDSIKKKKTPLTKRVKLHEEQIFKNRSHLRYRWK